MSSQDLSALDTINTNMPATMVEMQEEAEVLDRGSINVMESIATMGGKDAIGQRIETILRSTLETNLEMKAMLGCMLESIRQLLEQQVHCHTSLEHIHNHKIKSVNF
jgi:hypothetical protein